MSEQAGQNVKKMDIARVSSEDIQELYEKEFEKIAPFINIDSFDIVCNRDVQTGKANLTVTIYGTAGAPTIDQFKQDKIEQARRIVIERYDIGTLVFNLVPLQTVFLNSNDYQLTYISE
jgi:hypothetical protein